MRFDLLGIGNAIVDVVAAVPDSTVAGFDLVKGSMTLIDQPTIERLYADLPPAREASGGSVANSMAALASLGGQAAYIGRVRDDALGKVFAHDIRAAGVDFTSAPSDAGPATARCLVMVTDDAQRTMATYLGACVELTPDDIDETRVADAAITYLEGYLWDRDGSKAACLQAAEWAHKHGNKVALTLSDSFCVDRWRGEFRELIDNHIDILIANEQEIASLFDVVHFNDALHATRGMVEIAALTRGPEGCVVLDNGDEHTVIQDHVPNVVDTTGAGDAFAGGFLYGVAHKLHPAQCGRLGNRAAGQVIQNYGARAIKPLKPLLDGLDVAA